MLIDWFTRHPVAIVVIVMVVFSLIKQKRVRNERTPPADAGPRKPDAFDGDDGGYAERTRRIQEEIRRKIAERRGQPASVLSTPPPLVASAPRPAAPAWKDDDEDPFVYPQEAKASPPVVVAQAQASAVDPVLERQRLLAEQLAALELQRAAIVRGARAAAAAGASTLAPAAEAGGVGWLHELRNARSLRKAVVLREVIGPPAALR